MENINFLQVEAQTNNLDSVTTCGSTCDAMYRFPGVGDYCTCQRCPCCGKIIRDYPTYPYYNPKWYYCSSGETKNSLNDNIANVYASLQEKLDQQTIN